MAEDTQQPARPQDKPDAGRSGVSTPQPAEGGDDVSPPTKGSPKG